MGHVATEKRRKRDYPELFRHAIREALLTYRPFCLVFGDDVDGGGIPQDGNPLPVAFGLDEFFEPTSLPLDLFDLQHLHNSGASEKFLPPEKRGLCSSVVSDIKTSAREVNGDAPLHPPMLAPPVLHLL